MGGPGRRCQAARKKPGARGEAQAVAGAGADPAGRCVAFCARMNKTRKGKVSRSLPRVSSCFLVRPLAPRAPFSCFLIDTFAFYQHRIFDYSSEKLRFRKRLKQECNQLLSLCLFYFKRRFADLRSWRMDGNHDQQVPYCNSTVSNQNSTLKSSYKTTLLFPLAQTTQLVNTALS